MRPFSLVLKYSHCYGTHLALGKLKYTSPHSNERSQYKIHFNAAKRKLIPLGTKNADYTYKTVDTILESSDSEKSLENKINASIRALNTLLWLKGQVRSLEGLQEVEAGKGPNRQPQYC